MLGLLILLDLPRRYAVGAGVPPAGPFVGRRTPRCRWRPVL